MSDKSENKPISVTRVVNRPDHSDALEVRRAKIKVTKGPDKGLQKDLRHLHLVVGTSPECDLVLTDKAVSRRHLEFQSTEDGFRVRDLGSKNGSYLGKIRLGEVVLSEEGEINIGQSRLQLEILDEHDEYPLSSKTSFGALLGRSLAMRQVFAVLERAADSDTTILLEGESGTGKDLAAEMVHQRSPRKDGPFVIVDCGALKSTLAESELFGHRKGAYTGADQDRIGNFEAAKGGTVFLDEIGELDAAVQPKLLRLLEKREIKRLGENQYRPVDVRLIAATNRDLGREVEAQRFREDLFYRLSVVRLRMPSLRDRREDIGLLSRNFVQKLRPDLDPLLVISDEALAMFLNYDWPGNVRELRNVVERLLLFPDRPTSALATGHGDKGQADADLMKLHFHEARRKWMDRFEKTYLSCLLDASGGVVAKAAKAADIPRQTFHRLLSKHRLVKE